MYKGMRTFLKENIYVNIYPAFEVQTALISKLGANSATYLGYLISLYLFICLTIIVFQSGYSFIFNDSQTTLTLFITPTLSFPNLALTIESTFETRVHERWIHPNSFLSV